MSARDQREGLSSPLNTRKRKRSLSDVDYVPPTQSINLVEDLYIASPIPIRKFYSQLIKGAYRIYTHLSRPSITPVPFHSLNRAHSFSAPTTPSSSGLPLTSENLRKFHQEKGTMADFNNTPQKSSGVSKASTSALSAKVGQVREILYLNGLRVDDTTAAETFGKEIQKARELLVKPRHSDPSNELLHGINMTSLDYADRNKTTLTTRFFGVFQSQSRHAKQEAQGNLNQDVDDQEGMDPDNIDQEELYIPAGWAARDWANDGLDSSNNRVFQAGSMPHLDSIDENYKNRYTGEERAVITHHKAITQISLGLAFPFLGVEVKTSGDFEEAANQANPEGAALVDAHRDLKFLAQYAATSKARVAKAQAANAANIANVAEADTANAAKALADPSEGNTTATPIVPKPNTTSKVSNANNKASKVDFSTKAYTLVLQPRYAQINVHWVEISRGGKEGEGSLTYHMHCVKSYALNDQDQLKTCRAAVNNILDWGLGEHNTEIKALLKQIHGSSKVLNKGKGTGVEKLLASKKRLLTTYIDDDVDN
ncbi:MAG: hypothetical protein Q9207_003406 [Kuettlingeria erythrocarpa]